MDQVAWHTLLPENPCFYSSPETPWPQEISDILRSCGIQEIYRHQAQAIDLIRSGRHVVTATPTASGKTLIYTLPVLENILADPDSAALYIFPLKALAQDQLRTFKEMAAHSSTIKAAAAIYDGDTSGWHRRRIREHPPHVVLTNPEMLHLSFCAYHPKWEKFLSRLKIVVVDEVHTYRGVMGSHMAQVFRRFQRLCEFYGATPTYIFSSATVSNPSELAEQLTGLNVSTVSESGAPRGRKHLVMMNPMQGPAHTAILLLKAAMHRGLRTIAYTQSRKFTELIALWAGTDAGRFAGRISAYRSGFLPEERREIEAKLSNGELLAVVSTSALELGIDIGDLDLCILVGYPGTIVATWQRGGRVGRSGQDSALILIAGEDALDQYFMNHPDELITREPESAVLNPYNPNILEKHLACAATEIPLKADEPFLRSHPSVQKAVSRLEEKGILLRSADGKEWYAARTSPHRYVDLRGSGTRFAIVCGITGENKGEIDGFRAFRETHPGAIYLHKGDSYLVETLDPETRTVKILPARVSYYTKVRANKQTEILEVYEEKNVWGTQVYAGQLKVTDQVTGYEKWQIHGNKKVNIIPLDLPPQIFETEGLWFRIPFAVKGAAESEKLHFMGGIHAVEHAAIGIFPLLVMADRNDLGGISTPFHPQTNGPAVFIYDAVPGGAGISRQAFRRADKLLETTLKIIEACPCEFGCPSCVHSPKCGSGNRPIDKAAAVFLLKALKIANRENREIYKIHEKTSQFPAREIHEKTQTAPNSQFPILNPQSKSSQFSVLNSRLHYGVLDIETQRSFQEVGGWHRADRMGISCVVLYDSEKDRFFEFMEYHVSSLIEHLKTFDLIIGFNIRRFDYQVLRGYTNFDFRTLPTLDILEEIHKRLGYRLSLDHLAQITLGKQKNGSGIQALQWWKQGRIREIVEYCKMDVELTKDLFLYGREKGYLIFKNKAGNEVRVPVKW